MGTETKETLFLKAARASLPDITDEQDAETVDLSILDHFKKGWSLQDTVRYHLCLEEVRPGQDEAVALARMAALQKKYEKV